MYKHPETEHEVDEGAHEDCIEIVDELLHHVEEHEYPEHIKELVEGIKGELEEYEGKEEDEEGREVKDEDEISDDELEEEAHKEMGGKPHLMVKIKPI